MEKPTGYDEATAFKGEFETLPAGAYICQIIRAETATTYKNSRPQLVLLLDIFEGEHKGFYAKKFSADTRNDKKWPCVFKQITDGTSTRFFKGVITAIEESNMGYTWNWDESTLKSMKCGVVFGREQYKAKDGTLKWSLRPQGIRSVEAVRKGIDPPADKLYTGSNNGIDVSVADDIFASVSLDDDLPF